MYLYIKALHIIFVITWFAGLFYMVRLFIYNREACDKPQPDSEILHRQYKIMIRRLWLIITWPSCILTVLFGTWLVILLGDIPFWLWVKFGFVAGLLLYHWSLQVIYKQQLNDEYKYSGQQLRIWNEVATLFLFAIVILAVVKNSVNFLWAMVGLLGLGLVLYWTIKLYKQFRRNQENP